MPARSLYPRRAPAQGSRSGWRDAVWTLVGIRTAFWLGTALTLLWSPLHTHFPVGRAYDPHTDLLFGTFVQWDAQWFVHVADHGYGGTEATVFFPVYPLVVHGLSLVLGSTIVAGVLISLVAAGVAAVLLVELARPLLGAGGARDTLLLVALYPLAFVFTTVQSDALFLALSAGAFLAALRGRSWTAGILGAFAVGTRLLGLALVPPLLLLLRPRGRDARELARPLPVLLLPAALAGYALYLHEHLGDALAFQHAQHRFWLRHMSVAGPLQGLWQALDSARLGAGELALHLPRQTGAPTGFPTRDQLATWNVVHLVVLVSAIGLTWVAWRRLGAAYGLYSAATIALVLLSTPRYFPLASVPRYLLADFPLFMALAALLRDRPRTREVVLFTFACVGAVAAVAYSRKVWIG
jgi:hypothetical protein